MSNVQEKLNALLNRFDQMTEPFTEASVYDALHKLREEIDDSEKDSCSALQFESMAFGFCEDYQNSNTGWGTYYGPMMVMPDENGQMFESPSIQRITPDTLAYWQERSKQAKHPIFQCRYADLLWDFTKKVSGNNPDISFAKTVVDQVLIIIEKALYKHEGRAITKLEHALVLALCINDSDRITTVANGMIAFEDRIAQDHLCGCWGFSFENLIMNKKASISCEQKNKVIADLETRLRRTSGTEEIHTLNPHAAEQAAMLLMRYYRKINKPDDVKRVLRMYGQAFVTASKDAGGIVGSAWLQKVFAVFHDNGMQKEADALTERIREFGKKTGEEMQTFSAEVEIPNEKMNEYINSITQGTLEDALAQISWNFLPDRDKVEQQVRGMAKEFPIQYLMTKTIQDRDGRAVAQIGSLEEDLDGHIISQISQNMQLSSVFLRMVIEKLIEDKKLVLERLVDYLFQSPVYDPECRVLIVGGVSAYLAGDYVTAAHILIPQIEHTLRRLMTLTGGPIYKPARNGGLSLKILDDILRDEGVTKSLGEKIVLYFRVLLTDQRGWNLRNNICHGLQAPNSFGTTIGDYLIHAMLLLAQVREQENR